VLKEAAIAWSVSGGMRRPCLARGADGCPPQRRRVRARRSSFMAQPDVPLSRIHPELMLARVMILLQLQNLYCNAVLLVYSGEESHGCVNQRMSLIDDASRAHGVKEVTILTGIALSRQGLVGKRQISRGPGIGPGL
jgi:hypothetical protein